MLSPTNGIGRDTIIRRGVRWEVLLPGGLGFVGVIILVVSRRIGWGSLLEPGPGFFPGLAGIALAVCGLLSCRHALPRADDEKNSPDTPIRLGSTALVLAGYVMWILLMPLLGYVIATFLVSLITAKAMGFQGWIAPIILSIALAVFTFFSLSVWFYVDLPRGFLEGVLP